MSDDPRLDRVPIQVRTVVLEGNDHTSKTYIARQLACLSKPTNVEELNQALDLSVRKLHDTNIFKSVEMEVDANPDCGPGQVDVLVKLKEKMRYGASAGVSRTTDGRTISGALTGVVRNVFGYGERLEVSLGTDQLDNPTQARNFSVAVRDMKPLDTIFPGTTTSVAVYRNHSDWSMMSSFQNRSEGVTVGVTDKTRRHTISYDAAFREVVPFVRSSEAQAARDADCIGTGAPNPQVSGPSPSIIREAIVPSFKSALRYSYRVDTRRPVPMAPAEGYLLSSSVEAAGLRGDVSFIKAETSGQYHIPISDRVSLGLTASTGFASSWGRIFKRQSATSSSSSSSSSTSSLSVSTSSSSLSSASSSAEAKAEAAAGAVAHLPAVPIQDRFFKHSLFVRGVHPYSLSPQDGRDALGGDVYASASASISSTIPRFESLPLKPHVTINAGSVIASQEDGFSIKKLVDAARVSVGFGFILPTPAGRFELNFNSPYETGKGFHKLSWGLLSALDW